MGKSDDIKPLRTKDSVMYLIIALFPNQIYMVKTQIIINKTYKVDKQCLMISFSTACHISWTFTYNVFIIQTKHDKINKL